MTYTDYVDLEGIVINLGDPLGEEVPVSVKVNDVIYNGYTPRPPKVGYKATIRVYSCGGGWYPDNKIISWESNLK